MNPQYFKGAVFHTPTHGNLEYIEEALLIVNERGVIENVLEPKDANYQQQLANARISEQLVELEAGQYFLPGFVDLHVHAPQWPQAGVALDEPLATWLEKGTFPLEAKYSDVDFAKEVYNDLVANLLSLGTTTVLYFATIHHEASLALAEICGKQGQRGLVGKVVMDLDSNPDYYRDASAQEAIEATEKFILAVKELGKDVKQGIYPVVTPRFAPSCSAEALNGLGALAQKYDVHVQSHCSESQWAHDHIIERFDQRDTQVLNESGLLNDKSVMAHCNFIDEADGATYLETGTAVAHCPISNAYFANGVFPVKKFKEQGLEMGLGTDISGGYSPSLYDNIRQAVIASRTLEDGVDVTIAPENRGVADSRISVVEAFSLATQGGGEALSLPIGVLKPGYACDLQVIDTKVKNHRIASFGVFEEPKEVLQKILYLATKENIRQVWVQGNLVHDKNEGA